MKTKEKIDFIVDGEKITACVEQTIIDALISSRKSVIKEIGCKGGVCGACLCLVKRGGENPDEGYSPQLFPIK